MNTNNSFNEIEKLFNEEIRERKKAGRGIFSKKATKKGSVGALRTPYNMASPKERKKITKSEMRVYNVNVIPDYKEFKTYDDDKKKLLLESWREKHTNGEIAKRMNTDSANISYFVGKLGIARGTKHTPKKAKVNKVNSVQQMKENNVITKEEFDKLNKSKKMTTLYKLCKEYSSSELTEYWEVDSKYIHKLRWRLLGSVKEMEEKFGHLATEESNENNDTKVTVEVESESIEKSIQPQEIKPQEIKTVESIVKTESKEHKNFGFEFECKATKDSIESIMKGITNICVEDREYKITVKIE